MHSVHLELLDRLFPGCVFIEIRRNPKPNIRACKAAKHVALENPMSVIFKHMMNVQYIQPWQFGHPVNKTTGFALKNLPRLKATDVVQNPKDLIHNMPPSKNRGRIRSVTFPGIASAIVAQWGSYIKLNKEN
jgi:hypothetical protein